MNRRILLKVLVLLSLWVVGTIGLLPDPVRAQANADVSAAAPESHWIPDNSIRQRFAKINPAKIKRLEFGGQDNPIISPDPIVVTDKALIGTLYRALLAAERVAGHTDSGEGGIQDYMRIIVESDKTDHQSSNLPGEEAADLFSFNPINPEWCGGRPFLAALKGLEPIIAQTIRDKVTAIAPRVTSVRLSIDTDSAETIWEPVERKRLVDALKATDRILCRFTDPNVFHALIYLYVLGQEPLALNVSMGREKVAPGHPPLPVSPSYATILESYKRIAERYGDPLHRIANW